MKSFLFLLPLFLISTSLFAQNISGLNTDAHGELIPPSLDIEPKPINCVGPEPRTYDYVEEFPILKEVGCDSLESYEQRQYCSNHNLRMLIWKNLQLNPISRSTYIESSYYIRFVVSKKGEIQDIEILKRKGYTNSYLDKNVINSIKKLANTTTWHAGVLEGKKVNTRMVVPVKINLR